MDLLRNGKEKGKLILFYFDLVICGGLFYQVSNTIAGFQNRMGLFFFYEALLGFMCLTSLQVFSTERILFVRERANGYYSPGIYFISKVTRQAAFFAYGEQE